MALTVIDDNANVVDRVTGNIACIQSVTDTFFYSRDEVVRNCAAFDFVNEFETGSAFTRFNAKIDFTELAGARLSASCGERDLQHPEQWFHGTGCEVYEC